MRSKIKYILYICFFIIFLYRKSLYQMKFNLKQIPSIQQMRIYIIASGDLKIVNSMGQEIFADKLELDNKNKIHKSFWEYLL